MDGSGLGAEDGIESWKVDACFEDRKDVRFGGGDNEIGSLLWLSNEIA